jgi:hypothetical protein
MDGPPGLSTSVRSPSGSTADAPIADGIVDPPVIPRSSIYLQAALTQPRLTGFHLTLPPSNQPAAQSLGGRKIGLRQVQNQSPQ